MISTKQSYHQLPIGFRKILFLNWPVLLLVITVSNFGFLILYSVAEGNFKPWAEAQIIRFTIGLLIILIFSFIHTNFWKKISLATYLVSLILFFSVDMNKEIQCNQSF